MLDRRLVAGGAAIALVALAAVFVLVAAPRWAAGRLEALAAQQLGRSLTAEGGAHLDFAPLALRLDGAVLAGQTPDDDSLLTAQSLSLPLSLGQLLGGRPDPSHLTLTGAEVAFLVDEQGRASWDVPGLAATAMEMTLEQAKLRYFDARNNQSLEIDHVDGQLDLAADGGATFSGTAVINGRLVRIDADLKSVARVNADGSPLELALAADDGTANFSGRLSTANVLSLAGPVSLASDTPAPALRLLGLPLPDGAAVAGPIAIDGALDTAGRAFAIRNATLSLGAFHGAGDLAIDLRNDQPKLQASLTADAMWLDPFVPAAGAKNGDWGRLPLPFDLLKTFDAEVNVAGRSLAYGGFTTGAAQLKLSLAGGRLVLDGRASLADDGTLAFTGKADATAIPPSVGLTFDAEEAVAQPMLGALVGLDQLTGIGAMSADLTASGTTQEELTGTLKGTARLDLINGRIAGADFTGLMLAAKQKILAGWSAAPGGTAFDHLTGQAAIADGIATFRGLKIESADRVFTLEGLIDVLRQGIAVSATALVNGQPLLPVAVIARGPWAGPKIYPDIPNILSNPEGGFARLQDAAPLAPQDALGTQGTQGN